MAGPAVSIGGLEIVYLYNQILLWRELPQPNQQHKTKQNNLVGVVY